MLPEEAEDESAETIELPKLELSRAEERTRRVERNAGDISENERRHHVN
jgi:hypothetical protein